jgi:hypothetical protein
MEREELVDSHPTINSVEGHVWSPNQVRAVTGPGHGKCNIKSYIFYESPTLSNSSLPQIPLERQDSKNIFLRLLRGWSSLFFLICFKPASNSRSYLQGEIVSPISLLWDSCKVSKLLSTHSRFLMEV